MKLIIIRGASGSGKSTRARTCTAGGTVIVSADDSFVEADGTYRFVPARLGAAHGACFRRAIEALASGVSVIVDNTNTTLVEVAPYIALGQAYGAEISVVEICAPLAECVARNVHGVPARTIEAQAKRLVESRAAWPRFWPPIVVLAPGEVP